MEIRFLDYAARVQEYIEHSCGIPVITTKLSHSFVGDLNGAEIHIDNSVTPEQRLFMLAHLFGHTVQWNTNPRAFEIAQRYQPPIEESFLPKVLDYEQEAAAYGLGMLHQIGITELDDWFSRYSACDQAYLLHYYCTGQKADFWSFWQDKVIPIPAKPVPSFTPVRRRFRLNGVVI
jgi:hypothetical protein